MIRHFPYRNKTCVSSRKGIDSNSGTDFESGLRFPHDWGNAGAMGFDRRMCCACFYHMEVCYFGWEVRGLVYDYGL